MKMKFSTLLCTLSLPLVFGLGCIAVQEDSRGFDGEFCTVNSHCQAGDQCINKVCVATPEVDLSTSEGRNCDKICTYLQRSCGSTDQSCYRSCLGIVTDWKPAAQESFSACFAGEDSSSISCDEALKDDAPNICYNRIPLAADRQSRCDNFVSRARFNTTGSDEEFVELRKTCQQIGRVYPDVEWNKTAACADNGLNTEQFVDCLNKVFILSPKLVFKT